MKIKSFIHLSRPKHWLKNLLVFIPIAFAEQLFVPDLFISALWTFAAFCLISSAVYAVNDIFDVEKDRIHPIKNKRPIASGSISVVAAVIYALLLFAVGFGIAFFMANFSVGIFAFVYVALNLLYSYKLKHCVIIDCFCIAMGFVVRVFAGGALYGGITEWLFLTMLSASLFMAFGKRRGELVNVGGAGTTRKVLEGYNLPFLDGIIFVCSGLAIIFYSLWAIDNVHAMMYTVPLVIYVVCKYLLNVYSNTSHADPVSIILGDKYLVSSIFILGVSSVAILYILGN